ncbi:MAG: chemotaxis protein CheW [Acetobacteraceae bacterium]
MQDQSRNDDSRKLLSFQVGAQEFCVDVMAVREIRGWTQTTALAHAPSYVCGVINLRGAVLPVIDLAERLGLEQSIPDSQHVIIVVQIGRNTVGLVVSAVCDILDVTEKSIQPTPDAASRDGETFVQGLLTAGETMISLISVDQLIPAA